jgi:hypothetical protein
MSPGILLRTLEDRPFESADRAIKMENLHIAKIVPLNLLSVRIDT